LILIVVFLKVFASEAASSSTRLLLSFLSTRVCGSDDYVAAIDAVAVQCFDGLVRLRVAGHFDKSETLPSSGESVLDDFGVFDLSKFYKQRLQLVYRHAVRQISNVDVHAKIPFALYCIADHSRGKQKVPAIDGHIAIHALVDEHQVNGAVPDVASRGRAQTFDPFSRGSS